MYISLMHFMVQQKLTQCCKAPIPQVYFFLKKGPGKLTQT